MTSSAFSAQGSTIEIATGTGSALTITAIAPGNPTIITSAAHGLPNGNVVALAAIVGSMAATLNGNSYPITNITTNTFAVGVDTTGEAYTSGGTATSTLYTALKNVKSFSGFDGMASEIDVTNLASTAKELRLGIQDFGKFSMNWHIDFGDAGQNAVRSAQASGLQNSFKLLYPNGHVASFNAFVKGTPQSGGVDTVVDGTVELRVTGSVTIA